MARTDPAKPALRERVWRLLTSEGVARFPGARGRIPNFTGAEAAARKLAELPEWRRARVIKCNPDAPQLPVRLSALRERKRLFMAVPRLRAEACFLELDPERLVGRERAAASIGGAARLGRPTRPRDMPRIDLIVAGSVAVSRDGGRVGKGGGFSDLEFALLTELGLVGPWTTVVSTVHPLQIVSTRVPMERHDVPLDYIVTPDGIIRCRRHRRRPRGLIWAALPEEKIAEVPLLERLARKRPARATRRAEPRSAARRGQLSRRAAPDRRR